MKRQRVDVNLEELDRVLERGTGRSVKHIGRREAQERVLHALAGMLPAATLYGKDQERFRAVRRTRVLKASRNQSGRSRVTGATELPPTPAPGKSQFRTRNYKRAILVRAAKKAKCTRRKNRGPWCASWAKRRWRQPYMSWIECAATSAGRYSPRRSRKESVRRNTTRRRRR